MRNELQIFKNEQFGEVRTVAVEDKILFCGSDIAKALGYSDCPKAIRTHCKGVSEIATPTNGGIQQVKFITEGDIYRLVTKSQLPQAEQFESWVFDDILPSIRKHGAYSIDGKISNPKHSRHGDLANLMKEWRMWAKEMDMPPYMAMMTLTKYLKSKGEPFPEEMAYISPWKNNVSQLSILKK